MEYDSVKVEFENIESRASVFKNTKVVPFDRSYFHVLKKVITEIKTDYFWFFASFTDLRWFSHRNFVPTNYHMQVWYTTHPMGGLNKEGNVLLIPTNAFKAQIDKMEKLSDFENIDYNADPVLYQKPMSKTYFKLDDPFKDTRQWTWLINDNLQEVYDKLGGDSLSNITHTGSTITNTVTNGDITIDPNGTGTVFINGPLEVRGETTEINTTQLQIEDNLLELNRNSSGGDVDAGKDGLDEAQPLISDQCHVSHKEVNRIMAMVKIMVLMTLMRKSAPSYDVVSDIVHNAVATC